jgi:hypothetical protein
MQVLMEGTSGKRLLHVVVVLAVVVDVAAAGHGDSVGAPGCAMAGAGDWTLDDRAGDWVLDVC